MKTEKSGQVLRLVMVLVGILLLSRIANCHGSFRDSNASQPGTPAVTTSNLAMDPDDNQKNPLNHDIRLDPINCELPPISLDSPGQLQFVNATVTCLRGAWLRALRDAHAFKPSLTTTDQEVTVYTVDTTRKSCGENTTAPTDAPLYCGGRQKILWPSKYAEFQNLRGQRLHGDMLFSVMHEYGHHVQFMTGVQAQADRMFGLWNEESSLGQQIHRRIELQAQCLAGVAMAAAVQGGTVGREEAEDVVDAQQYVIEEPIHGSRAANLHWSRAGYDSGSAAACNTWAADPADVQ
ncbi:neutral zinc metallopeptidase [Nocardia sp. NPDC059240]|uniref:neutral zinc metallopeptidase n=1 Tax=Nocardia sp. NPDC059240 TaxID=3346786 RepID=UPI0036B10936